MSSRQVVKLSNTLSCIMQLVRIGVDNLESPHGALLEHFFSYPLGTMWLNGVGWDDTKTTSVEILEGLLDLGPRIHHERPVLNDGFA